MTKADFVACHNPSYIVKGFKMVRDVKPGGTFLVNCQWSDEEFAEHMPAVAKRYIANNNVNVYLIDAIDLAAKVGMGKRTNTVLQSAFFALAKVLPAEDALQYMKDAATKSYMKKGQAIVDANHKAIDAGATAFVSSRFRPTGLPPRMCSRRALRGDQVRYRQAGQEPARAHRPHGRRQPARFRLRRSRRRPV